MKRTTLIEFFGHHGDLRVQLDEETGTVVLTRDHVVLAFSRVQVDRRDRKRPPHSESEATP
jgi:hypothetical protein